MLTGSASANIGPFNGLNGALDSSSLIKHQSDPTGQSDGSTYTTGPKENDTCPQVGSGAPGKSDLTQFDYGVDTSTGDLVVYLGWHRATNNGSAEIDFELNQATSACASGVNPVRTIGDVLIIYSYLGSNKPPTLAAKTWDGSKWVDATLPAGSSEVSADQVVGSPTEGLFGEAVVNLTTAGLVSTKCEVIASAYPKTRTGSLNAFASSSIEDFVLPIVAPASTCGEVTVLKVDKAGAPLIGATFQVFTDSAGTVPALDSNNKPIICTTAIDSSGNASCVLGGLDPGTYFVKETKAPNGYTADPNAQQIVVARGGATTPDTLTFSDTPINGTIKLTKLDGGTGKGLQGAEFKLFVDNAPVGTLGGNDGTTALDTCTSSATGLCQFNNVAPGNYWAKETVTPNGFNTVDPVSINVPLTTTTVGVTVEKTVTDQRVPGTINVHKVDGVSGTDVQGAEFTLFKDAAPTGGTRDAGDTSTGTTCTTDAKGVCQFTGVAPGDYWVVETKAPTGYAAVADQAVTVKLGPAPNTGDVESLTFSDDRLPNGISLVKSVNANSTTTAASPLQVEKGTTLTYKVTVTNTGQVALTVASLTDSLKSDLPSSCTQGLNSSLAPGASFTCTYTSTAAVPSGGGLVVNTAAVGATDQFGRSVNASDSRHVQVLDPAIAIAKSGPANAHVGDKIGYTLKVTNPGNTGLSNVAPSDPKCDAAPALSSKSGGNQDNVLDVGETWTYTCTHTVTAADGNQVFNTATVGGTDVLGTKVTATSSHTTAIIHPAITITKTPSVPSANPGQTVTYTYVVTNPGDTPLSNVTVTDDKCSPVTFVAGGDTNGDGKLDSNETWTYTCSNQASAVAGDNTNVGTATGTDVLGTKVTAQATATITVVLAEVITKQTLPFTGAQVMRMLSVALTLLLLGTFLALTGRKRRQSQTER